MTTSTNASGRTAADDQKGSNKSNAAAMEALKLLALETAGAAGKEQRQLIASAVPVVDALFRQFLAHDIQAPDWPDRDRFIMSSSMQPLACALLRLLGHSPATAGNEDSREKTTAADTDAEAEHAETTCDPAPRGLDLPLRQPGHGLAAAVGMALATRLLRERFGEEVFNHATCVLVDDQDLEPGIAQETIAIAPWLRPHRLCVLHLTPVQADGAPAGRRRCPNHLARLAAAGWHVQQVRADDTSAIIKALEQAADQDVASWEERRPAYIAVEYDATVEVPSTTFLRQELGWEETPAGDVPGPLRDEWRLAGLRGRKARRAWQERMAALPETERQALQRRLERPFPEDFRQRMRALRIALAEQAAARDLQAMLPALLQESARTMPEMVALTALHGELPTGERLPADENAAAEGEELQQQEAAQLLDVGLRPMAVAALLVGMVAHGGTRPVGVIRQSHMPTMIPLLEEAARAGLSATLLVLEDDLCHSAPGVLHGGRTSCLCPADAVELVECWQLCLQQPEGIELLFVPHGKQPALRTSAEKVNLSALGGYELFRSEGKVNVSLYAAGWTLAASMSAAQALDAEGTASVRVVSVPAPERLAMQDEEHRKRITWADDEKELRLFVPPGEAGHAWSLLECGEGVLSPCAADGRKPEVTQLAARLRTEVLTRLGHVEETPEGQASNTAATENSKND